MKFYNQKVMNKKIRFRGDKQIAMQDKESNIHHITKINLTDFDIIIDTPNHGEFIAILGNIYSFVKSKIWNNDIEISNNPEKIAHNLYNAIKENQKNDFNKHSYDVYIKGNIINIKTYDVIIKFKKSVFYKKA